MLLMLKMLTLFGIKKITNNYKDDEIMQKM